jgi:NADPH:quinone reductase-like Zn-dependent oxidoreductase
LFKTGDRVMGVSNFFMGSGAYSEECVVFEAQLYSAPDTLPTAQAA